MKKKKTNIANLWIFLTSVCPSISKHMIYKRSKGPPKRKISYVFKTNNLPMGINGPTTWRRGARDRVIEKERERGLILEDRDQCLTAIQLLS